MSRRRSRVILGVLVFVVVAIGVDRLSLLIWNARLDRLVSRLKRESVYGWKAALDKQVAGEWRFLKVDRFPPRPPKRPCESASIWVGTQPPPSLIYVDGGGGLHLTFSPPVLAWTTWVLPPPRELKRNFGQLARFIANQRGIGISWIDPVTGAPLAHALVKEEHMGEGD
jgi:hypothetical protein